jgi:hypothetical protein
MRDIAFQCPQCSKNLAVGDRYVGVVFACPDCHAELKTPRPIFVFPCPTCGCVMFGPGELRGKVFGCPDCETQFEVPQHPTVRCAICSVHLEMDEECYHGVEGTPVECPQCQSSVDVPALPKPVFDIPKPAPASTVAVRCRGCMSDVHLEANVVAKMGGKLIRCPKCHRFLMVPHTKSRPEEMATRKAQAPKVMDPKAGPFARTMRLDDILETIPQARQLHEGGLCLYCNMPLRQLDERSFVCEHCWRIVRTVRQRHR